MSVAPNERLRPGDSSRGLLRAQSPESLRVHVDGYERGTLVLSVAFSEPPADHGLFLCVSKAGVAPSLEDKDYHWVSHLSDAQQSGIFRCRIQTHLWVYASPDAVVTLALGASAPPLHPDMAVYIGVYFDFIAGQSSSMTSHAAAVSGEVTYEASLHFESEVSQLPPSLHIAHEAFYGVYGDIDGMQLSSLGKDAMGRAGDIELTYGEVQFVPFLEALRRAVAPSDGESFIDLGSGTARAVLTAALAFPTLRRAIGYEVVPALHSAAVSAEKQLRSMCNMAPVELHETDFREIVWEDDIDIVWVSSLCMEEETKTQIARRAVNLRPGARIVTMDQFFAEDDPHFERVLVDGQEQVTVEMSFGESNVYVLRRTSLCKPGLHLDSLD